MLKNIQSKNSPSMDSICIIHNEETREKSQLFCAELPVFSSEHWSAAAQNMKISLLLVVDHESWDGGTRLEYQGKVYRIYRNYPLPSGLVELYAEERVGME